MQYEHIFLLTLYQKIFQAFACDYFFNVFKQINSVMYFYIIFLHFIFTLNIFLHKSMTYRSLHHHRRHFQYQELICMTYHSDRHHNPLLHQLLKGKKFIKSWKYLLYFPEGIVDIYRGKNLIFGKI